MKQWVSVLLLAVLIPLHANQVFENGKSNKASSKKRITLILPEKPDQRNPVNELIENGWNINKESFKKISSSDHPEIIFMSHPGWNAMDKDFYAKRIFTALDNGSLVVFDDSGWTPFNNIFKDNSMVTTIREGIDRSRKVLWRAKDASPEEARKWESKFKVSQSYAYRPGPGWTVIAVQKLKDGSEVPVIMVKPIRKGMVAACLGLEYMTPGGLSDVLEFLADQWQSQKKTLKK